MSIKVMAGKALELERDEAVVCVPVGIADRRTPAHEELIATLQSVAEHTDGSVPLLIAGSAARIEGALAELPTGLLDRTVYTLELTADADETQAVNAAISVSFPGDLALVATGIRVAANWLPRLRAAAVNDSIVASATPLSLGAAGVELRDDDDPELSRVLDGDASGAGRPSTAELAAKVSVRSLRLRPRIANIGPGCAYVRRSALELVGPLTESLPLDVALTGLARDAIAAGMVHVAADDVLVQGRRERRAVPAALRLQLPPHGRATTNCGRRSRVTSAVVCAGRSASLQLR